MAADVYSRAGQDFGGAVAADAARVVFSSGQTLDGFGVGMLVQQLQLSYQQAITRVYEIGTDKTFYIAGRCQGQVNMARIMGPRPVQIGFYQQFGNACSAAQNNINFMADTGCNSSGGTGGLGGGTYAFTLKFAVITNLGIQIGAQDMVINEQVSLMFSAMDLGTGV